MTEVRAGNTMIVKEGRKSATHGAYEDTLEACRICSKGCPRKISNFLETSNPRTLRRFHTANLAHLVDLEFGSLAGGGSRRLNEEPFEASWIPP